MLKLRVCALVLATVFPSTVLTAADTWKVESEEAALKILEQGRRAAGKLDRFEVEFLECNRDTTFETEEQSRVRAYFDQSVGCIYARRAVEPASLKTSRRRVDGQLYPVRCKDPETWLVTQMLCTIVDESSRTYEVLDMQRHWSLVDLSSRFQHYVVPPWFDRSVPWRKLKTEYVIERAESTTTEFSIEFAGQGQSVPSGGLLNWSCFFKDDRLTGRHTLVIDRKTLLPKHWTISTQQRIGEQSFVYTRFDTHPPNRELKLDLAGYQDLSPTSPYIETGELDSMPQKSDPDGTISALELGARILWCLLF
jgi:hypothetical protein